MNCSPPGSSVHAKKNKITSTGLFLFVSYISIKLKKWNVYSIDIPIEEIELIINDPPKNKAPDPKDFTVEFYQTCKKEMTPILYGLFQKMEAEGIRPNSSMRPGSS